jgi:hypothetical protein
MKSRHAWSDAFDLVDENGKGNTEDLKTLWNNIKGKSVFGQILVESNLSMVIAAVESHLSKSGKAFVPGSVVINKMRNAYTSSYSIVWSKLSGWQWVKYNWEERVVGGNDILHENEQYIIQESDWKNVSRNLHVQGEATSRYGF